MSFLLAQNTQTSLNHSTDTMKWTSLIITITTSAALSSANTLHFFQPGDCNEARTHVGCGNAGPGSCCTSGQPFCGSISCPDCAQGNDLYAFNRAGCSGGAQAACREPSNGAYCCLSVNTPANCAANWEIGGARKRDAMSEGSDANFTATPRRGPRTASMSSPTSWCTPMAMARGRKSFCRLGPS